MNHLKKFFLIAPWSADFGHGLIITVIMLLVYGVEPKWWYFALGIGFSVILDLDGLLEFLTYRNVGASDGRVRDHRDGLHFPVFWIIGGLIFIYFNHLIGSIFLVAVLLHFFNDSWGTGWGVQWLWPISKRSYKLFSRTDTDAHVSFDNIVVSWTPEEKTRAIETLGNPNWFEEYYARPTKISVIEFGTLFSGITLLLLYLWYN